MGHMTPEELGKIIKCDLLLMAKSGHTTGVDPVKRLVKEVKACWLEMETMQDKLKALDKLLQPPEGNPQLQDGSRMWYE